MQDHDDGVSCRTFALRGLFVDERNSDKGDLVQNDARDSRSSARVRSMAFT